MPVLLIVTFRPEFQPPWAGQPQVSMLTLNRLDRLDRIALVTQIAGDKTLPGEVAGQIAERTAALAAGGADNGAPGLRPDYGADYYAAFVVDPDGYRIEAYFGG